MEQWEVEYEEKDSKKEVRLMNTKPGFGKMLWGVLLLVCAAMLLTNKLGIWNGLFQGISIWRLVLSVIFIWGVISGAADRSFGQILFSLAILAIINAKWLHLEAITPWPVIGAAVLGTIGLNLLFPGFSHGKKKHKLQRIAQKNNRIVSEEAREGDCISYENSFGSSVKYISGEVAVVNIESSFGALEVYFTDAEPKDNSISINVESSFGEVVLNVPSAWRVIMNIDNSFGGVEEVGNCNTSGEKTMYIGGEVSFGHLKIVYM